MKKLFVAIILVILLAAITSAINISKVPISKVPTDTGQKLKSYANVNLKDTIKYSNFEILTIEKFDDYVVITFKTDDKEQRWFKTTKSFNKLIK